MLITIISDVHDNLINLDKALDWSKNHQVDYLFCCGDLTNQDTLDHLIEQWPKEIFIVQGNGCFYSQESLADYDRVHNLGRQGGVFELAGKRFGLCHEPQLSKALASQKPDIIFYGHTHKPWEETLADGIRLVNPGNLSNSRYAPTFACYDTEQDYLRLIIVDEL